MMELTQGGVYLAGGKTLIPEGKEAAAQLRAAGLELPASAGEGHTPEEGSALRETGRKGTMAYRILEAHNTSGNMQDLQIRFDKMVSHDITFVGIIQTARASGLEKFPIPYVLTNCHNSLCAVGGRSTKMTTCSVCPARSGTAASMSRRIRPSSISMPGKCSPERER